MRPKIKIVICGEGKTDYGIEDGRGGWQEGPLFPLLRNILPDFEIEFAPVPKYALKDIQQDRKFRVGKKSIQEHKLAGHGKNITKVIYYIREHQLQPDLFVYYGDTDKRENNECYEEAYRAFEANSDLQCIAMIPLHMIESWLLADVDALSSVMGVPRHKVNAPGKPEELWGRENDPNSNFPKNVLSRVLRQEHVEGSLEVYHAIAAAMSPDVLADKSPISFPPVLRQLDEKGYREVPYE